MVSCLDGLSYKTAQNMAESDSGGTSDRYEFDAPSHIVDLNQLETADNDDEWFGKSRSNILMWLIFS